MEILILLLLSIIINSLNFMVFNTQKKKKLKI